MHMLRIASIIKISIRICGVHYLLGGNAADINLEDKSSLLSESHCEDEH